MPGQEGVMPNQFIDAVFNVLSGEDLRIVDVREVAELAAQTMWYSGDKEVNPGIAKTLCHGISQLLTSSGRKINELEKEDAQLIEENYKKIFHDPENKMFTETEDGLKSLAAFFVTAFI